jgi:GTPase SAR1 family protein
MHAIFILGTAGSGKSMLTSRLLEYYSSRSANAIAVNLDPGVIELPYEPDVDVRDYVDIYAIMDKYKLGPNGALIMASDMIATVLNDIQSKVDELNPDYAIIDTPGQVELFAYRSSGLIFVDELRCDAKASIFLFDSILVSTPINLLSIALLATSIRLRLKIPQINALSKIDLVKDRLSEIVKWSSNLARLEYAITNEKDSEVYLFANSLLHSAKRYGLSMELFAVSSISNEGLVNLAAALSRILKQGEEVEY